MSDRTPVCAAKGRAGAGECRGRVQWHHPIPQQRIRREFPRGVYRVRFVAGSAWSEWRPVPKGGLPPDERQREVQRRSVRSLCRDVRNRQWACAFHHGQVEQRIVKFRRDELDASVEEFAQEFGLGWSLDRDYGSKEDEDAAV